MAHGATGRDHVVGPDKVGIEAGGRESVDKYKFNAAITGLLERRKAEAVPEEPHDGTGGIFIFHERIDKGGFRGEDIFPHGTGGGTDHEPEVGVHDGGCRA